MIKVDPYKCLRCGLCVGSCPQNAIFLAETQLEFNDACINCGRCVKLCPMGALEMIKEGN